MKNRFASALAALAVVLGVGAMGVAPAQADEGFVPISATSAQTGNGFVPISKPDPGKHVQPPRKPSGAQGEVNSLATGYYTYAVAEDNQSATGMKADAQITRPWLSPAETHTLWEMALCDYPSTGRNCIELGWTIDNTNSPNVNGSDTTNPHLFVGYWRDGVWTGWNAASPYYHDDPANTTIYAGISLNGAVGGSRHFRIQRNATVPTQWDVGYGTGANGSTWFQRVGWYDTSGSATALTNGTVNEWFGEVAGTTRDATLQCTDMLSGTYPTTTAGHLTENIDLYGNVNPDDITTWVSPAGTTGRNSVRVDATTARMGGTGPC
jgi:hypothetical protein